jgi:hypothetical protein
MALIIVINAVLCFGVIVAVVAPIMWAILTQERDAQAIAVQRWRRARTSTQPRPARPRVRTRRSAGVTRRGSSGDRRVQPAA